MSLLKKDAKKKPLRAIRGAAGSQQSPQRPRQIEKLAPCIANCPCGNDIRGWISEIAKRGKSESSDDEALSRAWRRLVETNPFPSAMGRVCPHPCEANCNRADKDGAVSINAAERFIGDWAIERKLSLSKVDGEGPKKESIGVVGAGPAGLSFAYQMARRGYDVTVYEKSSKPGGMLYWGVPFYRQPAAVLDAEIKRILDLGVVLKLDTEVGNDISLDALESTHHAIFVAIGAHKGRVLAVPGEDGSGVWTGVDYLRLINGDEKVDPGGAVAVVGGGDTAIDAARAARRAGAKVTVVYRRTREEMPAIESEIEAALKEGIKIEYLAAPIEVKRESGKVKSLVVRRMALGEPDNSGRRRPIPIEGSDWELPVDSIVAAISQEPDWSRLERLVPQRLRLEADFFGKVKDRVWIGGDAIEIGLAAKAIGRGRIAALAVHAELRGLDPLPKSDPRPMVAKNRIKANIEDVYPSKPRSERSATPVERWLAQPDEEIDLGITAEQFEEEMSRCLSCGLCFGCERCWMFCTPGCFAKVENPGPGRYYTIKMETCDGCRKCGDECPCGFIDML